MISPKSTPVTVPATVAHRRFGDLIRRAFSGREHFIVEKDGLPVVAIIPMAEYEELMRDRALTEERLRRFEEIARSIGEEAEKQGYTEEQMMAELKETRRKIFQEKYGGKE